jgi:hypothetical protein
MPIYLSAAEQKHQDAIPGKSPFHLLLPQSFGTDGAELAADL